MRAACERLGADPEAFAAIGAAAKLAKAGGPDETRPALREAVRALERPRDVHARGRALGDGLGHHAVDDAAARGTAAIIGRALAGPGVSHLVCKARHNKHLILIVSQWS